MLSYKSKLNELYSVQDVVRNKKTLQEKYSFSVVNAVAMSSDIVFY